MIVTVPNIPAPLRQVQADAEVYELERWLRL